MKVGYVYHLCTKDQYSQNKTEEHYVTSNFDQIGFIHCCTKDQLPGVLERFFETDQELIALEINPSKIIPKLIYEVSDRGVELFPHVYGPINLSSVEEIVELDYSALVTNR